MRYETTATSDDSPALPLPDDFMRLTMLVCMSICLLTCCSCQSVRSVSDGSQLFIIGDADMELPTPADVPVDLSGQSLSAPIVRPQDLGGSQLELPPLEPTYLPQINPETSCIMIPAGSPDWPCPRDEYLCDGGDRDDGIVILRDGNLAGLDASDTIAQFDTPSGETRTVASNRVCVYAPRFAATRQVTGVREQDDVDLANDMSTRQPLVAQNQDLLASSMRQNDAPRRAVAADLGHELYDQTRGITVDDADLPYAFVDRLLPFENLRIVRAGVFEELETARVEEYAAAAVVWSDPGQVEVILENDRSLVKRGIEQAADLFEYDVPDGKPVLRVLKLASNGAAEPGDMVNFTIRFDNVGDQPLHNVSIVDRLTTRLAYQADSQECSVPADFAANDSAADTLTLRWDLHETIEAGTGGVIRFQCRVR